VECGFAVVLLDVGVCVLLQETLEDACLVCFGGLVQRVLADSGGEVGIGASLEEEADGVFVSADYCAV